MKTVKIIVAILLFISLIPATLCVFSDAADFGEIHEEFNNIPLNHMAAEDIAGLPSITDKVNSVSSSYSFLTIYTFVGILAAGVFAIAWRKKFYGALTSGLLLLGEFSWITSIQKAQEFLSRQNVIMKISNSHERLTTGTSGLAIILLFLPMVFFLLTGVIEMIAHFVKKGKKAPVAITPAHIVEAAQAPKEPNIDDLKKYKELLDSGIITQEEFDAKKKQLLGL